MRTVRPPSGPLGRTMSRRELLRRAGRGSVVLGGAWLAAACGVQGQQRAEPTLSPLPPKTGRLRMANWPAYIDRAGAGKPSPTVASFQDEHDVRMQYDVVINDNEEFFGTIREPLSRGAPIDHDIIVVTDWMVAKMIRLGYVEPLHHEELPNFRENAHDKFRDPSYDPGNAHSIPWAAGITGIGYNRKLTGRELTSTEDLFDPAFEGHVGMFSEMRDTFGLILLSMGVDPLQASVDDVQRAQERLLEQKERGVVRGYYGNDYLDQLDQGNLWATMAWSGDVFALQTENPDLEFVVPEEGGMAWTDNMVIPAGSRNPTDAHLFMDYVYQPRIAANITEWVWYESPVAEVQEIIAADAQTPEAEEDLSCSPFCEDLANSPLVFPTEEVAANTFHYKVLDQEEEQTWNELFQQVTLG
jgi:spermidine/putrescine transport system substrate-binding protein